jgi:hypothetical protein
VKEGRLRFSQVSLGFGLEGVPSSFLGPCLLRVGGAAI